MKKKKSAAIFFYFIAMIAICCAAGCDGNGEDSDTADILVNVAPVWSPAPTDITVNAGESYFRVNGRALDGNRPSQQMTCEGFESTCSFNIEVMGIGSGASYCIVKFATPFSQETCSIDLTVGDAMGASISRNVTITVEQGLDISNCAPNPVDEGNAVQCDVTALGGTAQIDAANDTCGGAVAGGIYSFTADESDGPGTCFTAVELVENTAAKDSEPVSINEVNQAPAITSAAPTAATENTAFAYSPTWSDTDLPNAAPDNPGYTSCAISGNTCGAWLSFADCNASGTPGESDAPDNCGYTITVTDGYSASAVQNVSLTINEVNQTPYFTSAPGVTSVNEGASFLYNPTYADDDLPNGAPTDPGYVSCAVASNTCGAWLAFTGCGVSGTPGEANAPGNCSYSLRVTDGYGASADQVINLTLNEVNQAPAITSVAPTAATENTAFAYSLTWSDSDLPNAPPGDPGYTTCAISGNTCGVWLSFTGCNSSGTPGETDGGGSCGYTITVTDGYSASAVQNVSLSINEANQNPVWTAAPSAINLIGSQEYNQVNGQATDADLPNTGAGNPGYLTCSNAGQTCSFPITVTGSGAGAVDCNISFIPTNVQASCTVTVQVSDGFGATISSSVGINVEAIIQIAAGYSHTCALLSTGGVKCWGWNEYGQMGNNNPGLLQLEPADVFGLTSGVSAIAAGTSHTCALLDTGGLKCWGYNSSGQLGDNSVGTGTVPVDVWGLTSGVAAISAGDGHTCAVLNTGGLKCWGSNDNGQIGNGTSGGNQLIPVDVSGLTTGVAAVSAGGDHSCALTTGGGMKCWGRNYYGQVGDSTSGAGNTPRLTPVDVVGLTSGVTGISVGYDNSCAISTGGGLKCWGYNYQGQVGDGTSGTVNQVRSTPVDVIGLTSGVQQVSASVEHTCALITGNIVKCWGGNTYGELGDGSIFPSSIPVDVIGLTSDITEIDAGLAHNCAISPSDGVKCWGMRAYGQLGDGWCAEPYPDDVVGLGGGVTDIDLGNMTSCAVTGTGGVKCWGFNGYGQLGDGTTFDRFTPVDVVGLASGISQVSVANAGSSGVMHACAHTTTDGVKCWGNGIFGQLGNGSNLDSYTPVDVCADAVCSSALSGIVQIAAGGTHTCALTSGGAVKCWGNNTYGQIGKGTFGSNVLTPDDVCADATCATYLSGIVAITAGVSHTCALTTTGGVKCWGKGNVGELGNSLTNDISTPVDVTGLSNGIASISAGYEHNCAIALSGDVYCWGYNAGGQIGNDFMNYSTSPFNIPLLFGIVTEITAGGFHTCAITTGGGITCWGNNGAGQLGDGNSADPSLTKLPPVDVVGFAGAPAAISTGGDHTCGLNSTGGIQCWGYNLFGQVGNGLGGWSTTPVSVLW